MKSFWINGYSGRQNRWAPDGHGWVAGEPRKNGYDRWDYRDDRPELFCVGSGDQLSPEFLMFQSGSQLSPHISPKTEETRSCVFVIDFSDPRGVNSERTDIREQINAALAKLSPEHRAVVVLKEVENLQYHEIAEALNLSMGTVMSRLFYFGCTSNHSCPRNVLTKKEPTRRPLFLLELNRWYTL